MPTRQRSLPIERFLLRGILETLGRPPVRMVLWNGEQVKLSNEPTVVSIIIRDRATLFKLILNPELYFGDAYSEGRIELEGSLVALMDMIYSAKQRPGLVGLYRKLTSYRLTKQYSNSLRGSRKNIQHHYDVEVDFYKLWLDSQLVYTCGYFPFPEETLEKAQVAKMDHCCRKVQLQPGESVVEAGCGWGALALHMAKHYGVSVKAFNISHEQIIYARRRAKEEGLADRVEFIEDDYRNVSGRFDVFMSVGMLEHVGLDHCREFGNVIQRSLEKSGRGFLHFIGRNRSLSLNAWIRKRIFPGAYPPTLRQVMDIFEPWGFSILDVENLRLHYAKTLEHWLERFERSATQVSEMFDEKFTRAWRLYLVGSMTSFRVGWLQLFQIAFARASNNRIAWTRSHLYTGEQGTERDQRWISAMS